MSENIILLTVESFSQCSEIEEYLQSCDVIIVAVKTDATITFTIIDYDMKIHKGDLVLEGICKQCGSNVARVVEGE